jgi:hypothetical protein
MSIGDGKAKNIIEYLDNLEEKGKVSHGAVKPLRIATTKIMEAVDGPGHWQEVEVRSIDIDDYMARFANLTIGTYSTGSLATYKSRFARALGWYLQFLDKPGWTPNIGARVRSPKRADREKKVEAGESVDIDRAMVQVLRPVPAVTASTPDLIRYPFPLASGQMAELYLPATLSRPDAKRLANFLESLVIDSEEVSM